VRAYVGGTFALAPWSTHNVNGGSPSTTFSNSSQESAVAVVTADAGVSFNHTASVGVELGVPLRRTNLTQESAYFSNPFVRSVRYREESVFIVVRSPIASRRRIGVVAVGGAGAIVGSAFDRSARTTPGSNTPGSFGPETEHSQTSFAVTGGVDLTVAAAAHIRVVPQFRTFVIRRGDPTTDFGGLGLPKIVFRVGVGIQAVF
jgi:hypothetical protein